MNNDFFKMSAKGKKGRLDIFNEIGFWGTRAADFVRSWKEMEDKVTSIEVHIASPGGSLYDALAMFNTIQQSSKPVDMYLDGLVASAASVIAMAGRKNYMAENALLMLHNPYTVTVGNVEDHEAAITALEAGKEAAMVAYMKKSGKTRDQIAEIMDATTWYGAQDAKDEGFVDKVIDAAPMAAQFDVEHYGYTVPSQFAAVLAPKHSQPEPAAKTKEVEAMADTDTTPEAPKPATLMQLKAACKGADAAFLLAQLEKSATMQDAASAWTEELSARLAAKDAELADVKSKQATQQQVAAGGSTGVEQPVPEMSADGKPKVEGDPIAQWNDLVALKTKTARTKREALSAASKENPALHDAFVTAYNALHQPKGRR